MADNQHQPHGNYTPHALSDLTAGMIFPRTTEDIIGVVPILSDAGSAISRAEQLQGVLCLEQLPKTVRTTTVPKGKAKRDGEEKEEEEEEEAQVVDVLELLTRDYHLLIERTVVEDGPVVICREEPVTSRRVRKLIPSAYPPQSLDHAQVCGATGCRLSSDEQGPVPLSKPLSNHSESPVLSAALALVTPELLELVLFHLDIKTRILCAPRVCKFWLDTLNQSPLLRKANFFQSEKSPRTLLEEEERPRINPLLLEAFGDTFFNLSGYEVGKHPFRRAEYFWKLPWSPQALLKLRAKTGTVLSVAPTCRQRSFTRAGASWRRMLVSQPPPPFLGFTWLDGFPQGAMGGSRLRIDSLSPRKDDAGGVTMGQIYDTVQFLTMQQQEPGLFFRIRWDMTCERPMATGTVDVDNGIRESTNLVVEFWDDAYFNSHNYGPFSMEATRSVFKCEDAEKPVFDGRAWIEGLDAEAANSVPPNDDVELWEPLIWEPDA